MSIVIIIIIIIIIRIIFNDSNSVFAFYALTFKDCEVRDVTTFRLRQQHQQTLGIAITYMTFTYNSVSTAFSLDSCILKSCLILCYVSLQPQQFK